MSKRLKHQQSLERRVLHFIGRHHLVTDKTPLVVAVSGGQDSVCLLHVLIELKEELGVELYVAHLDHQIRGAESRADARYVTNLAHRLNIPATIEQRDVQSYHAERGASLEESAREVRYTFLAEIARSIGTDRVVVGHTLDDHAETVLMHLIRGTGTTGLRGLQPLNRWQTGSGGLTVIRPLLEVNRQETAEYCQQHRLRPRIDASNFSLSPLRNRIRHHLLPLLQEYNPQIVDALVRTARIADDDLGLLDELGVCSWQETVRRQGDTFILDRDGFSALATGLQRSLLRRAIGELLGSLKDVEARHVEEVLTGLTLPTGSRLSLPGGLLFSVDYNRYLLGFDQSLLCPFPKLTGEFTLKVPGNTLLPGWSVEAAIITPVEMQKEQDNFTAYLCWDRVGDRVVVRPRRRGDRFQPLGMEQVKKLGEFMIDARVPRAWRQRVPVVCSSQHILWVVGWRIDDRVKVTPGTGKVLRLHFERLPDDVSC
ncbi:MAG: tRNA lysidine(34) synthetase TilS [Dehalococcoidales bacterium]|nr:MAG: tRNA lysidine(34) synthetase TilS [Dehalococcoidales bacterium]